VGAHAHRLLIATPGQNAAPNQTLAQPLLRFTFTSEVHDMSCRPAATSLETMSISREVGRHPVFPRPPSQGCTKLSRRPHRPVRLGLPLLATAAASNRIPAKDPFKKALDDGLSFRPESCALVSRTAVDWHFEATNIDTTPVGLCGARLWTADRNAGYLTSSDRRAYVPCGQSAAMQAALSSSRHGIRTPMQPMQLHTLRSSSFCSSGHARLSRHVAVRPCVSRRCSLLPVSAAGPSGVDRVRAVAWKLYVETSHLEAFDPKSRSQRAAAATVKHQPALRQSSCMTAMLQCSSGHRGAGSNGLVQLASGAQLQIHRGATSSQDAVRTNECRTGAFTNLWQSLNKVGLRALWCASG
jgi:hypothetical protein